MSLPAHPPLDGSSPGERPSGAAPGALVRAPGPGDLPLAPTGGSDAARQADPAPAVELLVGRPLVVLTGAGLSTDSGIPDYRGPQAPARRPMTYQEFVSGPEPRQRYWARSHLGWGRVYDARPNAGHRALARIDPELVVTQNVDGLHEQAGSRSLVALHGRIADVACLDCGARTRRAALQERLTAANPGYAERHGVVEVRPDGDVALEDTADFVVPGCERCGGVLKPDVVFFGENVPRQRVQRCYDAVDALLDRGGALLVVGSSLAVMSGLRFVRRAARAGTPVVVANRGATRGDPLATYAVEAGCSPFLNHLAQARGV